MIYILFTLTMIVVIVATIMDRKRKELPEVETKRVVRKYKKTLKKLGEE